MSDDAPKIMTLEEVAGFLRFGKRKVYEMIRSGKLPACRIDQQWRFDRDRVIEWVNSFEGEGGGKKHSVLIVDNDKDLLQAMADEARRRLLDANIYTAIDGVTALLQIGENKPHVLVLDVSMPNLKGNEVCRSLKDDERYKDIHIIVLTGYPDLVDMMKQAGADEVLVKSITKVRDVVARIGETLQRIGK